MVIGTYFLEVEIELAGEFFSEIPLFGELVVGGVKFSSGGENKHFDVGGGESVVNVNETTVGVYFETHNIIDFVCFVF